MPRYKAGNYYLQHSSESQIIGPLPVLPTLCWRHLNFGIENMCYKKLNFQMKNDNFEAWKLIWVGNTVSCRGLQSTYMAIHYEIIALVYFSKKGVCWFPEQIRYLWKCRSNPRSYTLLNGYRQEKVSKLGEKLELPTLDWFD